MPQICQHGPVPNTWYTPLPTWISNRHKCDVTRVDPVRSILSRLTGAFTRMKDDLRSVEEKMDQTVALFGGERGN